MQLYLFFWKMLRNCHIYVWISFNSKLKCGRTAYKKDPTHMNTAIIILAITIICRKTDNKLCMTCECIGFYCERDLWKNSEKWYDNQKKRKKMYPNSKLHRTHLCMLLGIHFIVLQRLWLSASSGWVGWILQFIANLSWSVITPQTLWISQLFHFLMILHSCTALSCIFMSYVIFLLSFHFIIRWIFEWRRGREKVLYV